MTTKTRTRGGLAARRRSVCHFVSSAYYKRNYSIFGILTGVRVEYQLDAEVTKVLEYLRG
jgi:hypothetical protein